jgi:hypothetical protein
VPRQVTLAHRDAVSPMPGPGEVQVRLTTSGANRGDVKKRQSWLGLADGVRQVVQLHQGPCFQAFHVLLTVFRIPYLV